MLQKLNHKTTRVNFMNSNKTTTTVPETCQRDESRMNIESEEEDRWKKLQPKLDCGLQEWGEDNRQVAQRHWNEQIDKGGLLTVALSSGAIKLN